MRKAHAGIAPLPPVIQCKQQNKKEGVAFGSIAAQSSAPSHQSDSNAVPSFSSQSSTLSYVLRHRLPTGAKYGTECELAWMDVTEWKRSVSRRLTQLPTRLCVSPVRCSPASVTEHHSGENPRKASSCNKHRVLDIPDIPSCDIFFFFFSWNSLMSLPAGVIACTK